MILPLPLPILFFLNKSVRRRRMMLLLLPICVRMSHHFFFHFFVVAGEILGMRNNFPFCGVCCGQSKQKILEAKISSFFCMATEAQPTKGGGGEEWGVERPSSSPPTGRRSVGGRASRAKSHFLGEIPSFPSLSLSLSPTPLGTRISDQASSSLIICLPNGSLERKIYCVGDTYSIF